MAAGPAPTKKVPRIFELTKQKTKTPSAQMVKPRLPGTKNKETFPPKCYIIM